MEQKQIKTKDWWKKILCGLGIGIGCVLPGISGGVIAISFGLYEKMLAALTGLLKDFKKNFLFLLPIGIGGMVGVLSTSNILKVVIENYESQMFALFFGAVLGSLPTLLEEVRENGSYNIKFKNIVMILAGLAFVLLIQIFMPNAETSGVQDPHLEPGIALLGGFVLGLGIVIPGLSSSFLLVYLGLYQQIITAIAEIYIPTLFFAGIGFALGGVVMVVLMKFLMKKFHRASYFVIIGITLGSLTMIMPSITKGFNWVCILLGLIGLAFGIWQSIREIRSQRSAAVAENAE